MRFDGSRWQAIGADWNVPVVPFTRSPSIPKARSGSWPPACS